MRLKGKTLQGWQRGQLWRALQEMGKEQTPPRGLSNQEVGWVHVGVHVMKEQWARHNAEDFPPRMNFGVTEDVGFWEDTIKIILSLSYMTTKSVKTDVKDCLGNSGGGLDSIHREVHFLILNPTLDSAHPFSSRSKKQHSVEELMGRKPNSITPLEFPPHGREH